MDILTVTFTYLLIHYLFKYLFNKNDSQYDIEKHIHSYALSRERGKLLESSRLLLTSKIESSKSKKRKRKYKKLYIKSFHGESHENKIINLYIRYVKFSRCITNIKNFFLKIVSEAFKSLPLILFTFSKDSKLALIFSGLIMFILAILQHNQTYNLVNRLYEKNEADIYMSELSTKINIAFYSFYEQLYVIIFLIFIRLRF